MLLISQNWLLFARKEYLLKKSYVWIELWSFFYYKQIKMIATFSQNKEIAVEIIGQATVFKSFLGGQGQYFVLFVLTPPLPTGDWLRASCGNGYNRQEPGVRETVVCPQKQNFISRLYVVVVRRVFWKLTIRATRVKSDKLCFLFWWFVKH